jgi:hypothetical protein
MPDFYTMIAQLDLGEHTNEILEQRLISGQQINMKTTDTPRSRTFAEINPIIHRIIPDK